MITLEALKYLGYSIKDNELVSFMLSHEIDIYSESRLASGSYRTYIKRERSGFCLMFTDEAMFKSLQGKNIGVGPLFFTGIFFYAEGKDGYSEYKESLPDNIKFSDSRSELQNKLCISMWERERDDGSIIAERWDFAAYSIHATYAKKMETPTVILRVP